jgi:peroxiredoxin Q/BCP
MRIITTAIALALAATPMAAGAALKQGAKAPDFTTSGALGGKPFRLNLKQQLRRGPVVLYFFPKAFTQGCTLEAHAFSEAADDFKKLGAQVVGMSADDQPTLARFSVEECRSSFPVATATPGTISAYDVKLKEGSTLTNRTSYVIAPDGTVIYSYSSGDWKNHVPLALGAVRDWKATHRRGRR